MLLSYCIALYYAQCKKCSFTLCTFTFSRTAVFVPHLLMMIMHPPVPRNLLHYTHHKRFDFIRTVRDEYDSQIKYRQRHQTLLASSTNCKPFQSRGVVSRLRMRTLDLPKSKLVPKQFALPGSKSGPVY